MLTKCICQSEMTLLCLMFDMMFENHYWPFMYVIFCIVLEKFQFLLCVCSQRQKSQRHQMVDTLSKCFQKFGFHPFSSVLVYVYLVQKWSYWSHICAIKCTWYSLQLLFMCFMALMMCKVAYFQSVKCLCNYFYRRSVR